MTILAVEKSDKHIYVASDSRYSVGDIRIDNGTKIFKVDCVIRHLEKENLITSVGFAFDGNVTLFFNFKNRVEYILRNILVQPHEDDYDTVLLELLKQCYCDLCLECYDRIDVEGDVAVFFNSFSNGQPLAYKIAFNPSLKNVECNFIDNGVYFYGSGKAVAEKLYFPNNYVNIVRFMKTVLANRGTEETIGGNVQVGKLSDNGFEILGYEDFEEESLEFGPHIYYGSSKVPNYDNFIPLDSSFLEIYTEKERQSMAQKNIKMITGVDPNSLGNRF